MSVMTRHSVRRHLDEANLSVVVGALVALGALVPIGPIAQGASVVGLIVLVGAVVSSRLDVAGLPLAQRVSMCLGFGFLGFLLVGAVVGAVFPHVGIASPLSRWPLVVTWCVLDAAVVAWLARSRRDPVRQTFRGAAARDAAWAAALGLPPVLALVGVALLNSSRGVVLADVAGALAVAMALAAVVLPTASWCPPRVLLLASAVLIAGWQGTFRGGWLAGFDIQHEFYIGTLAINQGQFPLHHYVDPYGGMLSLTVWPAALHALTGITLRTTLGLVPALFLALALVVTWSTLRDRLQPRAAAALCALFFVGSSPILQELPQITRQCYALFFVSLLVLAITATRLSAPTARVLAIASGLGLAVTHYSSAYLAAGAVIVGCALGYLARAPRARSVLSWPVSAVIVGAAALWGALVARAGSSLSQIVSSIRTDGLQLLPGSGSVISRWLRGASVSQLVNASVIRHDDAVLRHTRYRFMHVLPNAPALVNTPAPTSRGVSVLGPALGAASTVVSELVLVGAVVAVVFVLWRCLRRDPSIAGVVGVALFFVVAAAVSRFSQTIGVEFGPGRVEAPAYLVFVAIVSIALSTEVVGARIARMVASVRRRQLVVAAGALATVVVVLTSTGLAALVEVHQQLPAAYSSTGEQAQRLLTPADIRAANWLAQSRPSRDVIQADRIGALALDDFGFNDRPNFFSTLDPIIVDEGSWLFLYRTNLVLGTTRGGNNARTGVFAFPAAYFATLRPVLYSSGTDRVYGAIPPSLVRGATGSAP